MPSAAWPTAVAPIVNAMHDSRFVRVLMEKTLGVHRDRLLPTWASETFLEWWESAGRGDAAGAPGHGHGRASRSS